MNQYAQIISQLRTPAVARQLIHLYGQRDGMQVTQIMRYSGLIRRHERIVGNSNKLHLISAPGRTEIGGNHTDHNNGKVLAAAVNLDALAAVTPRNDLTVNIYSDGYDPVSLSLEDLCVHEEEMGTTAALVRGVAYRMKEMGLNIGGFDAVINSTVASGSGLSSSASVEVLFCHIFDVLYNGGDKLDFKQRAIISQFAENVYFGKPSGLMDQMASSAGGLVYIDFANSNPEVTPISYDFAAKGYALVVVKTGGSHDDLTAEYAAIPAEMKQVAACFGKETLRPILPEQFFRAIPELREKLGPDSDRAILRAAHFFEENYRVSCEVNALLDDDIKEFFKRVNASGRSSFGFLQNIYPAGSTRQELAIALMLSEKYLRHNGAWRIHGGGFAGTILAFVPQKKLQSYVSDMEAVFGHHACEILDIRPTGPASIQFDLA